MRRLERSRRAAADLLAILDFGTRRFGDSVGHEYLMSFEVAFERLRTHPLAGRSADSVSSGLRRLVHRSHRIFYRVNDDRVVIVRVLHHSQDERRLLR